jgi:hypothetical protein
MADYLGHTELEALGLDAGQVEQVLRRTPLTGHNGEAITEAEHLTEILELLEIEEQLRIK